MIVVIGTQYTSPWWWWMVVTVTIAMNGTYKAVLYALSYNEYFKLKVLL